MRRTRSRAAPECSRRRRRSVCVCFNRCAAEKAAARGPPSAGPKTPSKAGASSERERERGTSVVLPVPPKTACCSSASGGLSECLCVCVC